MEKQNAELGERIANSRRLATVAVINKETKFDLSALLSMEAWRIAETSEARSSMLLMYQSRPRLWTSFSRPDGEELGFQSEWQDISLQQ